MAPQWTDLLQRNKAYAETKHRPKPHIGEADFELPSVFIFSCIDPRASAEELLDMNPSEAFISRNLGGRVKSSLLSLVLVEVFTKGQVIKEVIIIHHTDCGCTHNTENSLREALKAQVPQLGQEVDQLEFGTYDGSDLNKHKETIREDLAFFKSSPLVRQELKDNVRGYLYDIKSGKLVAVPEV